MSNVRANRVSITKLWHENNKIYVNRMYEYSVTSEVKKQAEKIINDWLKKARLALRIAGGSVTHPLVREDALTAARKRYPHRKDPMVSYEHNNGILRDYGGLQNRNSDNSLINAATDIFIPQKIDINSLSYVFLPLRYGDLKWTNTANRVRKAHKAEVIWALLNSAKLEDQ
jgi:hypothetical protein